MIVAAVVVKSVVIVNVVVDVVVVKDVVVAEDVVVMDAFFAIKQEVNNTVKLPPLMFPAKRNHI